MDIYRVSFAGHRDVYRLRLIEDKIEEIAMSLMREKEFVEFYVGRSGQFDISAASAIKRAQKAIDLRNSALILVLPYHVKDEEYYAEFYDELCFPIDPKTHYKAEITKRNEWMIDNSDLLISYVERESGGAYNTLKYAEKKGVQIINIAK